MEREDFPQPRGSDMRQFVRKRYEYALKYLCRHFGISEDDLKRISSGAGGS